MLIGELLIHHLDVLRWLLGPLRVVTVRAGRLCAAVKGEDHAVIVLEGQKRWALLDGNLATPGAPPTPSDRLELVGTRGAALFENSTLQLRGEREETVEFDLVAGYGDSYAAAIAHSRPHWLPEPSSRPTWTRPADACASGRCLRGAAFAASRMKTSEFDPLDPLQQVVAVLQEDIVLGRLPPGARLVEEDLADRLHTKRHVLRQAFVELERFGLVERKRNRGAAVRQLTLEDVTQIYAVRAILERAAAAQIPAAAAEGGFKGDRGAQREHDLAVQAGDAKAVFLANFDFHFALFAACGNPYWRPRSRLPHKDACRMVLCDREARVLRSAQREHQAMLKAIRDCDRRKLIDLCTAHLNISRRAYARLAASGSSGSAVKPRRCPLL